MSLKIQSTFETRNRTWRNNNVRKSSDFIPDEKRTSAENEISRSFALLRQRLEHDHNTKVAHITVLLQLIIENVVTCFLEYRLFIVTSTPHRAERQH